MPEGENLIPIGIDVAKLEADKQKVLVIFQQLFGELEKYDSKNISPINISGLSELNNSIKLTNEQLNKLNNLIGGLNTAVSKQGTTTKTASNSTKESDVVWKEYGKTIDDITRKEAKLEVQQTEAAQVQAELTVQVKENTLALKQQAQESNTDFQARVKKAQADKDLAKAEAQAKRDAAQAQRDASKATRDATAVGKDADRQLKIEAQDALRLSNAYTQLKENVREKEQAYVRLHQSAGKNAPETQAAFIDLTSARKSLGEIDKELESAAGGSVAKFGKALTGAFSYVRQLAYILPGIGIAGIFSAAFEAIGSFISSVGEADQKYLDLAAATDKENEYLNTQLDLLDKLTKAWEDVSKSLGYSADAQKRELDILTAQDYDKVTLSLNKVTVAQKEYADAVRHMQDISQEGDPSKAHDKLSESAKKAEINLGDERRELNKVNDFIAKATELSKLFGIEEGKTFETGLTTRIRDLADAQKRMAESGYKQTTDPRIKRQIELALELQNIIGKVGFTSIKAAEAHKKNLEGELSNSETILKQTTGALDRITDSYSKLSDAELEYARLMDQERRREREDTIRHNKEMTEIRNENVLNAPTSDLKQRLTAISENYDKEKELILSTNREIQNDINSTDADKLISQNKTNEQLLKLREDFHKKYQDLQADYEKRDIEATYQMNALILESYLKTNETISQDENRSFAERLNGFGKYLNGRREQIKKEYEKEKQLSDYENLTPKQQRVIDVKYQSQTDVLQADAVKKAREITHSFVARTIKDLKEENEALTKTTDVEKQYTAALLSLDNAYEKGEISLKKYTEARKHLAYFETLAKDTRDIGAAQQRIKNDKEAIDKNEELAESAALRLTMAQRKNDENEINSAKVKRDEILNGQKKLNEELEAAQKALAEAELKYAEDKAKELIQIQEKTRDNWKKIGEELIALSKEVVDSDYQRREENVERNIALIDKMYGHEIDSIERSSIAAKDKTALEIQLNAQKERADEEAEKKERRLRHDRAVADKLFAESKIIWDTERAVAGALAEVSTIGPAATALAISYGILGAIALAKVAASPVPALAEGDYNWKGGKALIGEAGRELIREPNKAPYYAENATIKYLPKGTQIIPTYKIPSFEEKKPIDTWEQTKWLAKSINKSQKKSEAKIINNISIDLGFEVYKSKILYGI